MPINFPDSPTDNQEFNGYIYDATRGVWDVKLASDPLGSLNLTSPAAGEALVFDGTSWVNQEVATPASVKTIDSDSIAIDFSDGIPLEKRAVAGDITITASNYTAGITKQVLLEGDTVKRTLTFPAGWNFINNDKPASIGIEKENLLSLYSFGSTESNVIATWNGESAFEPVQATGGLENDVLIGSTTYRIHTFTSSDAFIVTDSGSLGEVEYLIVAGGGGGGAAIRGGGGGAGGLITSIQGESSGGGAGNSNKLSVLAQSYPVVVGAGGASGPYDTSNGAAGGQSGNNSSFGGITTIGGGGGGASDSSGTNRNPKAGGSGGGGWYQHGAGGAGTTGQGYSGGTSSTSPPYGAGGGGAGAPGGNAQSGSGGFGGDGVVSSIAGNTIFYAGGGSSSDYSVASNFAAGQGGGGVGTNLTGVSVPNPSSNGTAGLGGGGGASGNGGSGVVIVRYPITDPN